MVILWQVSCGKNSVTESLKRSGFQPVPGWECLFVHRKQQLFLSVYVDDFKMAGNKANLNKMWKELGKEINLEPPVPFSENIYLGVKQMDVEVPQAHLEKRKEFVQTVLSTAESSSESDESNKRGGKQCLVLVRKVR